MKIYKKYEEKGRIHIYCGNIFAAQRTFTCGGTDNPSKFTDCKINLALILTLFHYITLILIERYSQNHIKVN